MILSTRIMQITSVIAVSLLFLSSSSAIDLSRAFGQKKDSLDRQKGVVSTDPSTINSEIAIQNAKKLVDDMNDASTGTITSYQPGREKEPVTCNDIMAKALVVANEEKAAVVTERDSVVKAASILSERIDDLDGQLQTAREKIDGLERKLKEADVEHAQKLEEAEAQAEQRIGDIKKDAEGARAKADAEIVAVKEEMERSHTVAQSKLTAERERSVFNMDNLKNATAVRISKIEADCKEKLEAKEAFVEEKQKEMEEAIARKDAQVAEELAHAKDEIERVQMQAKAEAKKKDIEVSDKLAAAEKEVERIRKEAEEKMTLTQKIADEKVAAILSRVEGEKQSLVASTKLEIDNMEKAIQHERKQLEEKMADLNARTEAQINEKDRKLRLELDKKQNEVEKAKADAEQKIATEKENTRKELDKKQQEMDKAKSNAEEKIAAEKEWSRKELEKKQQEMENAAADAENKLMAEKEKNENAKELLREQAEKASLKERELMSKIEHLTNVRSGLEKDVSYWVETHKSQGYCNVTLLREDSRRILSDVLQKARTGLGQSEEIAKNAAKSASVEVGRQLQRAQSASSDGLMLVEKEFLPRFQKFLADAQKKAASLYAAHLAEIVNKQILPVYNQHFRPVYQEHFGPIVKLVNKEVEITIEKLRNQAEKARVKAVALVEETCSSAIRMIKRNKRAEQRPAFVMNWLRDSSKDGTNFVENMWRALLILVVILCRPLIRAIIRKIMSIIWFFCPLRLFVSLGRSKKEAAVQEIAVKEESKDEKKKGSEKAIVKQENPEKGHPKEPECTDEQ
mmetsp:Transcript_4370/g.9026  ORF Transcript_4370/g.9026 Transcript_4370/m.9026 type:complete len:800 (-) Transcript_4370:39-2438(-)